MNFVCVIMNAVVFVAQPFVLFASAVLIMLNHLGIKHNTGTPLNVQQNKTDKQ